MQKDAREARPHVDAGAKKLQNEPVQACSLPRHASAISLGCPVHITQKSKTDLLIGCCTPAKDIFADGGM
jgi:hypothetical protein